MLLGKVIHLVQFNGLFYIDKNCKGIFEVPDLGRSFKMSLTVPLFEWKASKARGPNKGRGGDMSCKAMGSAVQI
jgi:hypothetical protein